MIGRKINQGGFPVPGLPGPMGPAGPTGPAGPAATWQDIAAGFVDKLPFAADNIIDPGAAELIWDDSSGTLALGLEPATNIIKLGQHEVIRVFNPMYVWVEGDSGAPDWRVCQRGMVLQYGQMNPEIATDLPTGAVTVRVAPQAQDFFALGVPWTDESVVGLALTDIKPREYGYAVVRGVIGNLNTALWAPGDFLYITQQFSYGIPNLTNVKPTGNVIARRVGIVLISHAAYGKILVDMHSSLRSLDDIQDVFLSSPAIGQLLQYTPRQGANPAGWRNTSSITGLNLIGLSGVAGTLQFNNSTLGVSAGGKTDFSLDTSGVFKYRINTAAAGDFSSYLTPLSITVAGVVTIPSIAFTDLTVTGNTILGDAVGDTVTINASRILGDFSNASFSSRVMFKASVDNSITYVGVLPNGTGIAAGFTRSNSSDPSNAAYCYDSAGANEWLFNSMKLGTGAILPIKFRVGSTDALIINNGLGSGTEGSISNLKVTELNGGPLAGFRNRIINGGFDVWQRGTSVTPSLGSLTSYVSDRWASYQTGVVLAVSSSTGYGVNPYAASFTGAGGNTEVTLFQCIEAANTYSFEGASAITLSCAIYSTVAKAIALTIDSANVANVFSATTTQSSSVFNHPGTGWATTSLTWTSPGSNCQRGLRTRISFGACTTGTFKLTSVQLETGTVATPFEARPIGIEEMLCKRYYEKLSFAVTAAARQYIDTYPYAVPKRSSPTIILLTGTTYGFVLGAGVDPVSAARCTTVGTTTTDLSYSIAAEL